MRSRSAVQSRNSWKISDSRKKAQKAQELFSFFLCFCASLWLKLWCGAEAFDDFVAEGAGVGFDGGFVES